jgi:pyrroloquinoline quinone (PQQ) biosynthesis protein C
MDPRLRQHDNAIRRKLDEIVSKHLPSQHPFFGCLAKGPSELICEPHLLAELLHRYQAAMHATRSMAYSLPMLDSPELRKRKLQILIDDDGLADGDTHHYQLTRAFISMGVEPKMDDDVYSDLETLQTEVDAKTARFIAAVRRLYARSLGAWAIVECLSDDWMHSLADALAVHYPGIVNESYFAQCFADHVEENHGREALELVDLVCSRRPEFVEPTLRDADEMASELTCFWDALHEVIQPK